MGARPYRLVSVAVATIVVLGVVATPAQAKAKHHRPVITSLSTTLGSVRGGTLITIHGKYLTKAKAVSLAYHRGSHLRVVSSRTVQVRTPATPSRTTTYVRVRTRYGTSTANSHSRFTYVGAPAVTNLSTHAGPLAGVHVTIHGLDFYDVRSVTANGVAASSVRRSSSTTLTAVLPTHAAGVVNVAVRTGYGTSRNTSADDFRHVARPVITELYPPDGPLDGRQGFEIRGSDLGGVQRVTVDGRSVGFYQNTANSLEVESPAHAGGTVDVTATTAGGTSVSGAGTKYTYTISNPDTWTSKAHVFDSDRGSVLDVSCPPGTDICVAIDEHSAITWTAGHWGEPLTLASTHYLRAVSCPTSTFCLVTTYDGFVITYSGAAWSAPVSLPFGSIGSPSCGAAGECMAITHDGAVVQLHDGAWSDPQRLPLPVSAISCADAAHCVATGFRVSYAWDGQWGPELPLPLRDGRARDLDCASPTLCAAVDILGTAVTFDGATWSPRTALPLVNLNLAQVACTDGRCFAVSIYGEAVDFDGTSWAASASTIGDPTHATNYVQAFDCASPTVCVAGEDTGTTVVFDGDSWAVPERSIPTGGYAASISCPAVDDCLVADSNGNAYRFDGSSLGPAMIATPSRNVFNDISCTSTSFCVMVSPSGPAAVYDGNDWTRADPLGEAMISVSCLPGNVCIAIGKTHTEQFDGVQWHQLPDHPHLTDTSVSCATPTFCAAGGDGAVGVFDGSGWTSTGSVDLTSTNFYGRGSVACPSVGHCLYASQRGNIFEYKSGRWSAPVALFNGANAPRDISCVSDVYCALAYDSGAVRVYDGRNWSAAARLPAAETTPTGSPLATRAVAISCASTHHCSAVGGTYAYSTG